MSSALGRLSELGVVEPPTSKAGLHIGARLGPGVGEHEAIARLAKRDVAIDGFTTYALDASADEGLVVGLGTIDDDRLGEALVILEEVLVSC